MNPQDPQQQYGQPTYVPQNQPLAPQQQVPQQPVQMSNPYPPISAPTTTQVPAPTPGPGESGHNPYEFIFNPDTTHHKAPVGNSVLRRVLVIVGVLVVLTILGSVVAKLLVPADTSIQQVTTIAQEQTELVRVATYVAGHADGTELVNLAINTEMSINTNKQAAVNYAATRGTKLEDKILTLKKDAATDKLFAAAISSNTFDTTATQTLNAELGTYQTNLKKAYAATTGKKARALLQDSYDTAVTLAAQGATIK